MIVPNLNFHPKRHLFQAPLMHRFVLRNFITCTVLHRTVKPKESIAYELATRHEPARLVRPSKYSRES